MPDRNRGNFDASEWSLASTLAWIMTGSAQGMEEIAPGGEFQTFDMPQGLRRSFVDSKAVLWERLAGPGLHVTGISSDTWTRGSIDNHEFWRNSAIGLSFSSREAGIELYADQWAEKPKQPLLPSGRLFLDGPLRYHDLMFLSAEVKAAWPSMVVDAGVGDRFVRIPSLQKLTDDGILYLGQAVEWIMAQRFAKLADANADFMTFEVNSPDAFERSERLLFAKLNSTRQTVMGELAHSNNQVTALPDGIWLSMNTAVSAPGCHYCDDKRKTYDGGVVICSAGTFTSVHVGLDFVMQHWPLDLNPTLKPANAIESALPERGSAKRASAKRGPKFKFKWDDFDAEANRRMDSKGEPDPSEGRRQATLATRMLEWAENNMSPSPLDTSVKDRVRGLVEKRAAKAVIPSDGR